MIFGTDYGRKGADGMPGSTGLLRAARGVGRLFAARKEAILRTLLAGLILCSTVAIPVTLRGGAGASAAHRESAAERKITAKAVHASPTARIPVMMFHSISVRKGDPYCVPPKDFESEMKWLHDKGYQTLSLDEVYGDLAAHAAFPARSVALTFDDGYEDNYTDALPILRRYGFCATVFIITGDIGKPGYLSAPQILAMERSGVRAECHTVTHRHLSDLPPDTQLHELRDSRTVLEQLLGRPVNYLAYPYGDHDAETVRLAKELGYRLCFDADGGAAHMDDPRTDFPRAFGNASLSDFIGSVEG